MRKQGRGHSVRRHAREALCVLVLAACDDAADGVEAATDAGMQTQTERDASQVDRKDAGVAGAGGKAADSVQKDSGLVDVPPDGPDGPGGTGDAGSEPPMSTDGYDGCPIHVSVATMSYGTGNNEDDDYAPNNVGAIWVTDASGAFIRTVAVWSPTYYQFATTWIKQSGGSRVDIIASATRRNHDQTVEVDWDCRDKQLMHVAPGSYRLNVEFTEVEKQGPLLSGDSALSFEIGVNASAVTRPASGSFGPVSVSVTEP